MNEVCTLEGKWVIEVEDVREDAREDSEKERDRCVGEAKTTQTALPARLFVTR